MNSKVRGYFPAIGEWGADSAISNKCRLMSDATQTSKHVVKENFDLFHEQKKPKKA